MTIPTQMSLHGFIASESQLRFTENRVARFYACIGADNVRRESNGRYPRLAPTFHDLVLFGSSAERAYRSFRRGDTIVAAGYVQEYVIEHDGSVERHEEFVARHLGHDFAYLHGSREQPPLTQAVPTPRRDWATEPAIGV